MRTSQRGAQNSALMLGVKKAKHYQSPGVRKRSIKTTDRNDPEQDTAVQCPLETIGCPSASNGFASLQTEEDIHEVDELGEELLQGAKGTQPMNQIGKERPYGSLTKASPRVVDAEENLHDQSRDILEKVHSGQ